MTDLSNLPNTIDLSNGNTVPRLGLGTWQMLDDESTVDVIKQAVKTGYRLIDTATMYGNETSVGQAVVGSGVAREDLFVTTKLAPADMGKTTPRAAYQASLDRLGLDYADLYLIHHPLDNPELFLETWRGFEQLYRDGLVKAIGVSNFEPEHLQLLRDHDMMTPMVNQIHLHPYKQQRDSVSYCQQHDIVVQSYSPLMQARQLLDDPVITDIASRYDRTVAQIVLRWHLQKGLVPIPKSSNPDRLAENYAVYDFILSDSDMDLIDSLDGQS